MGKVDYAREKWRTSEMINILVNVKDYRHTCIYVYTYTYTDICMYSFCLNFFEAYHWLTQKVSHFQVRSITRDTMSCYSDKINAAKNI